MGLEQISRINEHYDIDLDVFETTGAFNAVVGVDRPFFLDPTLLEGNSIPEFQNAKTVLDKFFSDVLTLIATKHSRAISRANRLMILREIRGVGIGYGARTDDGSAMDPEFGQERLRASQDQHSFPVHLSANLLQVLPDDTGLTCTIGTTNSTTEYEFDYIIIATGQKPRLTELNLAATGVAFDDRGNIVHDATMRTSVPHIFVAGDVTGHHQILHFAAEMGKTAGTNATTNGERVMDYDRHLLAVSFDQFPSAFIGLTETEATKRGIAVVTATKHFNSIGLGILKRQEYGLWKVVADAETGQILGAQVLGPSVAGELVQLLVPIIYNQNTAADIMAMTWYHPTYAEILYSLARDICKQKGVFCPGV